MGATITNNMKNKLNKFITGSLLAILLAVGLASAQTATPTPEVTTSNDSVVSVWGGRYGDQMMNTNNWNTTRNGRFSSNNRNESWKEMMPAFVAGFIGLGIAFSVLGILLLAFWIWMLVHAATSDIKQKPLWLLVIWFMNIVGAIIYFFVVKRKYDEEIKGAFSCHKEEGCGCGEGKCACHEETHSK